MHKSLIMKSFFLTPEQYADLKGRYAKFNEPWTADEAELVRLYREGIPFAELAAAFGRTEGAILSRLIRLRASVLPDTAPAEVPGEAPMAE